jgi:S-phase kinase-associated protein 1
MNEVFGLEDDTLDISPSQIEIVSKDNKSFPLDRELAMKSSGLIRAILENDSNAVIIPFDQINSNVMELVILFIKHDDPIKNKQIPRPLPKDKELKDIVGEWCASFVDLEKEVLFDLVLAAHYLDIESLLHLACSRVALLLRGKTVEEIKEEFQLD